MNCFMADRSLLSSASAPAFSGNWSTSHFQSPPTALSAASSLSSFLR